MLDFGIAKLEAIDDRPRPRARARVLGTPAYMSPEQARGDKTIDARTDVYALGAILYELLAGEKPHPGDSHNAILHHIATQPAVPLPAAALGAAGVARRRRRPRPRLRSGRALSVGRGARRGRGRVRTA